MAEQTSSRIVIDAPPSAVMAVIADFASYPTWARGVKAAEVLTEYEDGRADEVQFTLDAAPITDEYTLAYEWDGDRSVRWKLVEARMLKAMEGAYILTPKEDATDVRYELAVDLAIPMIGLLKRKAEKVIIDTALKGLKKRVESGT
jgi:ribosome-associated toxin RatA of RatAB toxin-antitoxin module